VNHNISRLLALFGVIGQLNGFATGQAPDFRLVDLNTKSERYMAPVSPRDYLLQVTGYYFGWST
jgi:hypothetical protein